MGEELVIILFLLRLRITAAEYDLVEHVRVGDKTTKAILSTAGLLPQFASGHEGKVFAIGPSDD